MIPFGVDLHLEGLSFRAFKDEFDFPGQGSPDPEENLSPSKGNCPQRAEVAKP